MAHFTDQDLLDEIRFDIKVKDFRKAELVLAALKLVKRETQKKALFEVSRADAEFSIPLLAGLFVHSPDIADAFPHLKETMYSKILGRPDVLQDLILKEGSPDTRNFLVETAGRIQLADAVPALMDVLGSETDANILHSAVTSLGMIGDPKAAPLTSEFLDHADGKLARAAAEALGEIGTPEAIHTLAARLGKNPELDHCMIDIFAKARTPEAVEYLNKTLASEHAHIRTAGKEKLGAIGVMSVRVLIKNLERPDPDLVIHSLNVLGDIGDAAAVAAIRNLLHNEPEDANIRFAAYETLGRLPLKNGAFALAAGLDDPVDNVRSAAAKAIDRNYNALLAGGVRNMITSDDESADLILETIINSQCDQIVMDFFEEDFFTTRAVAYLSDKAHPDIRSHYADILNARGLSEIAGRIATKAGRNAKTGLRIYTVDDSKMILNIYRSVLHKLGCESIGFEFPAEALEQIRKNPPDVILTDLNMPGLTGIALTAKIRERFSREQLPVIMVTTQQESEDFTEASTAGVNGIIKKPFTALDISTALKKYAGYRTLHDHL